MIKEKHMNTKKQIDSLFEKYKYLLPVTVIGHQITQFLFLQSIQGSKSYENIDDLLHDIKTLSNQSLYIDLLDSNIQITARTLELYKDTISLVCEGQTDSLGIVFENVVSNSDAQQLGQFYTPPTVAKLCIDICLQSQKDKTMLKIYDPTMGTGGLFIAFSQKVSKDYIHFFGQEFNRSSWKLAKINALMNKFTFDFGLAEGNTLTNDFHPDLRADIIVANPPYNQKSWSIGFDIKKDVRFKEHKMYENNANFAWFLHILHHLKDDGVACVLISNNTISTNQKDEKSIRSYLIDHDFVESIIMLPSKLFSNTSISIVLWVLNKTKKRRNEVLFIDLSKKATPINKKQNVLDDTIIEDTVRSLVSWRDGQTLLDSDTYLSIHNKVILENDASLVMGRYHSTNEIHEDIQDFKTHFSALVEKYDHLVQQARELDIKIKQNLLSILDNGDDIY